MVNAKRGFMKNIITALGIMSIFYFFLQSATAQNLIKTEGSDSLVIVAHAWAEAYQKIRPDVAVAVTGGGSGTGIAALINGFADIANASRKMTDKETDLAKEHGYDPQEFVVGYDALAIFLHPNNPISSLSISQLAEIFGEAGKITQWSQLNIHVPGCKEQKVIQVGRHNVSGTYAYLKKKILGKKREYKLDTLEMHSSKDIVVLVEKSPCAIGYSGLAYATPRAKLACISENPKDPCVFPTLESAVDGSYPLARPLFMYTGKSPKGEVKNYLDWILSDEGQCIIRKRGYAPVRPVNCN
jgi:phosphate transport system substrate-binding protein